MANAERFDAGGDGRNLVEDAEAGFDFLRREAGVANGDLFKDATVGDEHPVGADEPIETGVQLVSAAPVV